MNANEDLKWKTSQRYTMNPTTKTLAQVLFWGTKRPWLWFCTVAQVQPLCSGNLNMDPFVDDLWNIYGTLWSCSIIYGIIFKICVDDLWSCSYWNTTKYLASSIRNGPLTKKLLAFRTAANLLSMAVHENKQQKTGHPAWSSWWGTWACQACLSSNINACPPSNSSLLGSPFEGILEQVAKNETDKHGCPFVLWHFLNHEMKQTLVDATILCEQKEQQKKTILWFCVQSLVYHVEVSWNRGTPKSSHFSCIFPYKPSIIGVPPLTETHMCFSFNS